MMNRKRTPDRSIDFGFGLIPPQNRDIERAVLGALLIDNNCLNNGMVKLFPEIFYVEAHGLIFHAIEKIYDLGQPVDMLNVVEQLKKDGNLEKCGGMYAITKITDGVMSGANIENHILLLCEHYLKRQTIEICGTAVSDAFSDETDAFDVINKTDNSMQVMQEKVLSGQAKDISYFGVKMIEQHDSVKQTGVLGISTGLKALDDAICGLVAPDLFIIAARPGQGKTAMALSITHYTSVIHNVPCLWFSLEMDGVQLVRRLASIDTGINHEILRNGKSSSDEYQMLLKSIEGIGKSKIFIEDKTSVNVRDIRTRANLLKKKHNIGYIVVDYIQLMHGIDSKNKSREQEVSEISRGLKCLAKELSIPVIALSQLSREVEKRPDKMPQLSDLRESGAIEQDADGVLFLMRPEYYKMTEDVQIRGKEYSVNGLCIGSVAKNRHGSTCNIALSFRGETMHFYDNQDHGTGVYLPESGNWKPFSQSADNQD